MILLTKGRFKSNELKISSKPNRYSIEFSMDFQRYKNIIFKPNNITINILDCEEDDITIIRNNIPHCERPICNCGPKISEKHICKKGYENIKINSVKYNKCVCTEGHKGENCNELIFYDKRYLSFLIILLVYF